MPSKALQMMPSEIRSIRQGLGLTQVEAGELLGGGSRAFTKYESGTVKPAASVINLLRLLQADPPMIKRLVGRKAGAMSEPQTEPFTVSGEHIGALTERALSELLRRVLSAEAQENGIPASAIHVASSIHAPDGGEDGRIAWTGGPDRTPFLPGRLCLFQLKASKIKPAAVAHDIVGARGDVKPSVRAVIEGGGHYIMLCTHRHVRQAIEARKNAIHDSIQGAGLAFDDSQVDFRDGDQIATWVNRHPAVGAWIREKTQPGLVGPFRSWSHWAGRPEHEDSPWVEDERLTILRGDLRERVSQPRSVVRVVGPSGVGKTRLVLEAIGPKDDGDAQLHSLSDLVLYAVESEVGAERLNETVQSLADAGNRAVVVVDECSPETHRSLSNMVVRQSSSLSLVSIDHEAATGPQEQKTLNVAEAAHSITRAIIERTALVQHHEDQRRLAHFCKGFPKIAIQISHAWVQSVPVARATDDDLVDAFVLGRRPQDQALLLKSAALLATFGLVYREPLNAGDLTDIAGLAHDLEESELRSAVDDLRRRGIAQSRGRAVLLQPRPIAMMLAERQWLSWIPAEWDRVLAGNTRPELRISGAGQLALLNTTETAHQVVQHVCRPGGPFDGFAELSKTGNAEVLSSLAEIDPAIVAERFEGSLEEVEDLTTLDGDLRRHLVWALEKVAFDPRTFEDGARLLLRLATAETEYISNNATGQFKALFPVFLGSTAADGEARLKFLDAVCDSAEGNKSLVIAEALAAGSETHHFMRFTGAEAPGSRPAFESWQPGTEKAAFTYIAGCVTRLIRFATRSDRAGMTGRARLAEQLRPLVSYGFIDAVEMAIDQVGAAADEWPQALEALGKVIVYDSPGLDRSVVNRVKALIARLEPASLESRLRFLVTEMPWDYPCDEQLDFEVLQKRQQDAVSELARDVVTRPGVLASCLPQLSHGNQRMAFWFGHEIAKSCHAPLQWLEPMITAVSNAPEGERDHSLLSGFVAGLAEPFRNEVASFKERAARSPELAPTLPPVCWQLGIKPSDIGLVLRAFNEGLLEPFRLLAWCAGGRIAQLPAATVSPLIEALLVDSAVGFAVGVELMGVYAHKTPEKLDGFQQQIRTAAANSTRWDTPQRQVMTEFHFEKITTWLLRKGRGDKDATATALALARSLAEITGYDQTSVIKPIVPKLLSSFPEIAWPLVGQGILSDAKRAWHLRHLLGNVTSFRDREKPALLSLPEDTLFAWCHAHPDGAPAFAASILPFLTTYKADATQPNLHPIMARMIREFGNRDDVLNAIRGNIGCYAWSGSLTTYYTLHEHAMRGLRDHQHPTVRGWARNMLRQLRSQIEQVENEDEEQAAV